MGVISDFLSCFDNLSAYASNTHQVFDFVVDHDGNQVGRVGSLVAFIKNRHNADKLTDMHC
jgi:hypothetical protein